ncbi:hypothetical protein [uncultured Enterococcus sp.]|nr:hypothetical protein [uncultured Enterococcus sp.]
MNKKGLAAIGHINNPKKAVWKLQIISYLALGVAIEAVICLLIVTFG